MLKFVRPGQVWWSVPEGAVMFRTRWQPIYIKRQQRWLLLIAGAGCIIFLIAGILAGGFWYNQANPVRQAKVEAGQGYRHTNGSQIPDAYNWPAGPAIAPMKPTVPAGSMPVPTLPAVKTPTAVPASPVALQAYYKVGNPGGATINQIMPQLELSNTGKSSVDLSEVTIRYWYMLDIQQPQSYWCDYAAVGCANISGSFVSLSSLRSKANTYLEIRFTNGAGNLAPGANSGEIQNRFNKDDWSNYQQAHDYSYEGSATTFTVSTRITVYYKGTLVWGSEPDGLT